MEQGGNSEQVYHPNKGVAGANANGANYDGYLRASSDHSDSISKAIPNSVANDIDESEDATHQTEELLSESLQLPLNQQLCSLDNDAYQTGTADGEAFSKISDSKDDHAVQPDTNQNEDIWTEHYSNIDQRTHANTASPHPQNFMDEYQPKEDTSLYDDEDQSSLDIAAKLNSLHRMRSILRQRRRLFASLLSE